MSCSNKKSASQFFNSIFHLLGLDSLSERDKALTMFVGGIVTALIGVSLSYKYEQRKTQDKILRKAERKAVRSAARKVERKAARRRQDRSLQEYM